MKNWIGEMFEKRFENDFSLNSVGHAGLSLQYNQYIYRHFTSRLLKILADNNITFDSKSILEVGVGSGYFIENVYNHTGGSVTGIDITEVSVRYLSVRYPHHTFKKIDVSSENIGGLGQFDLITMFNMVFHIVDEKGFDNAIKNVCNALKQDGYLIITDMFARTELEYITPHIRFRSFNRWKKILDKNNMEIVGLYPLYFLLDHPRDIKNIHLQNIMVYLWDKIMIFDKYEVTRNILLQSLYYIDGFLSNYCNDCNTTKMMLVKKSMVR